MQKDDILFIHSFSYEKEGVYLYMIGAVCLSRKMITFSSCVLEVGFTVPGWFFMVPGWFSWFFTVPCCFFRVFMVPGQFSWFQVGFSGVSWFQVGFSWCQADFS